MISTPIFKFSILVFAVLVFFSSCSKEEGQSGCTDPEALNYNYLAVIDDGSCEYLDSSFTIWSNGKLGYWGDPVTGSFELFSCYTGSSTIFLNPDTIITPPDTIIDNSVTPPDTTITPADTTINGDTYLHVNSDSTGNYQLIIKLYNKKSALDFIDGYLSFNAKLSPTTNITDFGVIINGNQLNFGGSNCANFHQSDVFQVPVANNMDTSSFRKITIPLNQFTGRYMQNMDLVFGIKGNNAAPDASIMYINSVRWSTTNE